MWKKKSTKVHIFSKSSEAETCFGSKSPDQNMINSRDHFSEKANVALYSTNMEIPQLKMSPKAIR